MQEYLILKLESPLQSWGKHSFEGLRPSEAFPSRSGLLGLFAAALGIDRDDAINQDRLNASFGFSVRFDHSKHQPQKLTDYHTIKNARQDYHSLKSQKHTIETWREYWQDAKYTAAVWNTAIAGISIKELIEAIKKPVFTLSLGRRSCPLVRPLFDSIVTANNSVDALNQIAPQKGTIYSEDVENKSKIKLRDVPIAKQPRQFATRMVYLHADKGD
jgi:CRISPR system Cascade subunit CasD